MTVTHRLTILVLALTCAVLLASGCGGNKGHSDSDDLRAPIPSG